MKKKVYKILMTLAMVGLFVAVAIAFTGCGGGEGPTSPSSDATSCSGYAGGDERGKWAERNDPSFNSQREYTGSIYRRWTRGQLSIEVPYRKPQYNKITFELSGATYYNCFEVNGDVMRMDTGTFDRVR